MASNISLMRGLGVIALTLLLAACETTSNYAEVAPTCDPPAGHDLEAAFRQARNDLTDRCPHRFDEYVDSLLSIAEGDPGPHNRRRFSEFFVFAADQGLISRRQAQEHYNRYFNVKFVALRGDYNNCSHTCPRKADVVGAMEHELSDKERGLLRITQDADGYYRASRLFQETELVLEATCSACSAKL